MSSSNPFRRVVDRGEPADTIVENATVDTLIAMTTHGYSGSKRWWLGSVADKVLRGTSSPLLLVRNCLEGRPEGEATLTSVVVPLDGSELSEVALPTVADFAEKLAVEILLLRVYANPYGTVAAGGRHEIHVYLEEKKTALRKRGVKKVSCVLREGDAAEEIVALAKESPESLIVMASHGRTGLKRWVLGSVAESVARHSNNPVLIVRGG